MKDFLPAHQEQGVLTETEQYQERMSRTKTILQDGFDQFDEVWIVGHKGDQATNLQEFGVVKPEIDVVHTHSTLGVSAIKMIDPPKGSSGSYETLLTEVNPDMEQEIRRVKHEEKKVVILMPFPNTGLEKLIDNVEANNNFSNTAPIAEWETFELIENKETLAYILDSAFKGTRFEQNIIPWAMVDENDSYASCQQKVGNEENETIYMQRVMSGGGDGTEKITSQEKFDEVTSQVIWDKSIAEGNAKITKSIEDVYPTNGTGCIVPTADGGCMVLVDPPSHKPVGLKELNTKAASGSGNDWSTPQASHVQDQYVGMTVLLGKYLYEQYGVSGLFGPDGLRNGQYQINECNARFQGTTPYQTLNATMNKRVPLELIHYMVKLANNDPNKLTEIEQIVGNPISYNQKSVNESGGFYIKVGGPKERSTVTNDLNGAWLYDGETMTKYHNKEITQTQVYTQTDTEGNPLQIPRDHALVWVKAPEANSQVGGELAPIGYILGSGMQVFTPDKPGVTQDGKNMYDVVTNKMFS